MQVRRMLQDVKDVWFKKKFGKQVKHIIRISCIFDRATVTLKIPEDITEDDLSICFTSPPKSSKETKEQLEYAKKEALEGFNKLLKQSC